MSAVMSTLSMISGGRRAHRKLASRKSGQFSDAGEERARSHHDLKHQQRSASLQTLETGGGVVNLDNLEAKMASIEVSLAGRRRSAGRELDALRGALADKDSLIQSLKKQLSASLSAARLSGGGSPRAGGSSLSAEERRALQQRAAALAADLQARQDNIQLLRKRLDNTHVTDHIDSRIQQAELQYQLGREELDMLSLAEQARALQHLLHAAERATLYSLVRECGGQGTVVCAETRDGSWGASPRAAGLQVDWTADHCPLRVGDRVVEVNGAVVAWGGAEELRRAVDAAAPQRVLVLRAPAPATQHAFTQNEAVSLRAELGALKASAEVAEKAKESLRADNTRLTHRISYLEEQVAELLATHHQLQACSSSDSGRITVNKSERNVTHINIGSESPRGELQVFQKGPDITALVAGLPGLHRADPDLPLRRPRSQASGASSRAPPSPRAPSPPPAPHDYCAETDAAIRMIERNRRHMERRRLRARARDPEPAPEPPRDPDRIQESIKKTNWAERKTLSIIEQLKRSQRLRKAKKTESAEDVRAESPRRPRSELESEWSEAPGSEPRGRGERGAPPCKPLRLSLHKARSAHSLLEGAEGKRPVKRTHAGPGARDSARATPRPSRKHNGLSAPQPDALYPDSEPPRPRR